MLGSYTGRRCAHMEHSLSRGTTGQLNPFYQTLVDTFSIQGVTRSGGDKKVLSEADAFVLTRAIAGVMRGFVASASGRLLLQDIEASLPRLVVEFVDRPVS